MGEGSDVRYDGTQLATRGDVVVVTLNYRLGAMGFLYLGGIADEVPWSANAGLLDQVAALEWVRDNIAAFGGDPGRVTIFGESAGGMAVVDLMAMPKALGLFHGVIAQSGAGDDVASVDEASEMTGRVLDSLGIAAGEAHKISTVPTNDLLAAQQQCQSLYLAKRWGLSIRPVIDGTVMPTHPRVSIAEGRAANVPLLVGTNLDEWRAFADPASFELDETSLRVRLHEALGVHAEEVLSAYRACRPESSPSDLWFAIESDRNFRVPAIWLAEVQRRCQERTFSYLFTWPSVVKQLGSCHAIDVPFVFGTLDKPGMPELAGDSATAWELSSKVQDAWLAFAKTGNPSADSLPAWSSYDASRRATMIFDDPCNAADAPFDAERLVWESLPLRPLSLSTKALNDEIASR
jgi:para-nitrobenzyl esterase